MAAQSVSVLAVPAIGSVDAALAHVAAGALSPSSGRVGLELEFHLVDRRRPERGLSWAELETLRSRLPVMPGGSRVTVEPGGQLELSTPAVSDVVSAVAALRRDRRVTAIAAEARYGR